MSVGRQDAPSFVCDLLEARSTLDRSELSARWVAKELGQTTGFIYHHWGSFDGFLLEVSGVGWSRLGAKLAATYERSPTLAALVEAYVDFAWERPVLYWLLAERPMATELLRERLQGGGALPSFEGFQGVLALVRRIMPGVSATHARALHAAVHGLASQMLSNRLGSLPDSFGRPERKIAGEIGREIARVFSLPESSRSRAGGPKAGSPKRPRTKTRRSSSSR